MTGGTDNKYLFAGEQWDSSLYDYYMRSRYYDSSIGRFIARDSFNGLLLIPTSLHKYLYADNNPVNRVDPSGLFTTFDAIGAVIIASILTTTVSVGTYLAHRDQDLPRTFYRGTSFFDALETVESQHIDVERIIRNQSNFGFQPERTGVYFTSQESTASYYADLVGITGGQFRAGGPGILRAIVSSKKFQVFATIYGITVEAPVPNPPIPGQTETLIPFVALPAFENIATYSLI